MFADPVFLEVLGCGKVHKAVWRGAIVAANQFLEMRNL